LPVNANSLAMSDEEISIWIAEKYIVDLDSYFCLGSFAGIQRFRTGQSIIFFIFLITQFQLLLLLRVIDSELDSVEWQIIGDDELLHEYTEP
jgi:hypothetical protein